MRRTRRLALIVPRHPVNVHVLMGIQARKLRQLLQSGLARLGVRFLLPADAYGSTLLSCALPAGFTFERLHDALKPRGYVIYAAQGALKQRAFRLGLVGHFGAAEVRGFLDAFAEIVRA